MIVGWLEITLVLLGLYLLESLYWLRSGGIAFIAEWGRFHPAAPSDWHSRSGSPQWGPTTPFGLRLITQEWPFAVSPRGIQSGLPIPYTDSWTAPDAGHPISFEEVRRISSKSRTLYVNDLPVATLQTSRLATDFAMRLQRVWKCPREARTAAIRVWIRERLDLRSLEERAATARSALFPLRVISTVLSAYLLVLVPSVMYLQSFESSWPRLLLGWLLLIVPHSMLFVRAHRRVPGLDRSEVVRYLLLHLCAPMTATRAHVHLVQEAFDAYDPLIVARALSPGNAHPEMLRAAVFRRIPMDQEDSPVTNWFHREFLQQLTTLLRGETASPSADLCAPPRDAPVSASYCPRCHSQYVIPFGRCVACNVDLAGFDAPISLESTSVS